jgi:hypothetical protein
MSYKVVDSNEYIDTYDFSSLITEADNQEIMRIAKGIIDSGNYFENSPKYQTKENLFGREENVFLKMRQSFIYSCFMYLGKEVKIKAINSWVFMTKSSDEPNRDNLWHKHHYDEPWGKLSGIWYLHIPADIIDKDLCGTEFSNTTENVRAQLPTSTFFVRPKDLTWHVYPSKMWHRSGITNSEEYRFVYAADMDYIE